MKIACVIVTFNRLDALKRAIRSVESQSRSPDRFIVVDNASDDGTAQWLMERSASHAKFTVLQMENNCGGAGGFHHGIEAAWRWGADWIWTMDDDCEADPDALAQLLTAMAMIGRYDRIRPIGFLASRVDWIDGRRHVMNAPGKVRGNGKQEGPIHPQIVGIRYSSFVSMLLNRFAVERIGLPIKEFFLYGDDVEYTKRITTAGFLAYSVEFSRVRHMTMENQGVTMDRLVAYPPRIRRRKTALRNLVAVNRGEPYGAVREPLRLLYVWFRLVTNGTPVKIQLGLLSAGIGGLLFDYKKRIRFPTTAV